jgi:hypothetical protein
MKKYKIMSLLLIVGLFCMGMGFPYVYWQAKPEHKNSDKPAICASMPKPCELAFLTGILKRLVLPAADNTYSNDERPEECLMREAIPGFTN